MKILSIREWGNLNGLVHTDTTWKVVAGIGGQTVVGPITTSVDKLVFMADFTETAGIDYYGVFRRHFSNGTVTEWSKEALIEIAAEKAAPSIPDAPRVGRPLVYVDKDILLDDTSNTFDIELSDYTGHGVGHIATSYFVISNGKAIFSKIDDRVNLLSLTISKVDIDLSDVTDVEFVAIYHADLYVESPPGKLTLALGTNNIVVETSLRSLTPDADHVVFISKKDINKPLGLARVIYETLGGETTYTEDVLADITSITVPRALLIPNTEIVIKLVSSIDNTKAVTLTRLITVTGRIENNSIDINHSYANRMYPITAVPFSDILTDNILEVGFNNNLITPIQGSTLLHSNKFTTSSNTLAAGGSFNINTLSTDNTGTVVHIHSLGRLVIESINATGVPVFSVLGSNAEIRYYGQLSVTTRDGETRSLAENGSMHTVEYNTIIYAVPDANMIRIFTPNTGDITDMLAPPLSNVTYLTLVRVSSYEYMAIGGDGDYTYILNTETNTYRPGSTIPPKFRGVQLKTSLLGNGDSVVMRRVSGVGSDNNSILYYDSKRATLEELVIDLYTELNVSSLIKTRDHKLIIIDNESYPETKRYIFD